MHAIVHGADMQDRDGGALLMASLFGAFPFLLKLYADGGYQGPVFQRAMQKIMSGVNVEIVKRSDTAKTFVICRNAGSSSERWRGWEDAAGSPGTGKTSTRKRSRSCASPRSASCSESYVIRRNVSGQTLIRCGYARLPSGLLSLI